MDNSEIIGRYEALKSERSGIEEKWRDIEEYVTPYRGEFFKNSDNELSVEWSRYGSDYDSTAVMAHQNLAASLHGSLTSPSVRWFEMRYRDEDLNKDPQATGWLQEVSDRIYYELQDSNFNLEVNETYQDLVGLGTSVLTLEEAPGEDGWNGLLFSSVPVKESYFEEDYQKRVLRFYRELKWTPQQIISKFGDDVPQSIKDAEKGKDTEKRTVLYTIFPRGGRIVPIGEKRSPSKRPLVSRYILVQEKATLGKDGGLYEMPAYVARWRKTSGSKWGNSPAMFAMGDIKSLNTAKKQILIASEKRIEPPILAEERANVMDLDLRSGQVSVVRDIDGVKAWDSGHDIYVSQELVNDLQASIKEYFFSNDLSFPEPQGTPMSATEAQIRYELMQRLLGPTLGRLENDLLTPIVARAFKMLMREQRLPQPPQSVIDKNADFDVVYIGPLARAQRSDRVTSIERLSGFVANLAQINPETLDVFNFDEAIRHAGRDLGVPAELLRGSDDVEQIRDARAEQQMAMQEAMIAEQQGKAAQAQAEGQNVTRQ